MTTLVDLETVRWVLLGGVVGPNITELPGNGGPYCASQTSALQRTLEMVCLIPPYLFLLVWASKRCKKIESDFQPSYSTGVEFFRWLFFAVALVTFVAQVCYKVISGNLIYILNPCHVITFTQIYLLWSFGKTALSQIVAKVVVHSIYCPLLAIFFPAVNTLFLPFELELFWIQHYVIVLLPIFFLYSGAFDTNVWDKYHRLLSIGVSGTWNLLVLQSVSLLTWANLNSTLCPVPSDPLPPHLYRLLAIGYVSLLSFVSGQVYTGVLSLVAPFDEKSGLRKKKVKCSQQQQQRQHHQQPTLTAAGVHKVKST